MVGSGMCLPQIKSKGLLMDTLAKKTVAVNKDKYSFLLQKAILSTKSMHGDLQLSLIHLLRQI